MSSPAEGPGDRSRRRRTTPSPTVTSTNTDDTASGTEESVSSVVRNDAQLAAVLGGLPSSSKELLQRIERQKDEVRLLQEENTRLRAREVEVSALTLRLQQQFAATQSQVDRLKSQIRTELMNPVTEEEYRAIDALEEGRRDLLDTVKLGIYQQLGAMRASRETAMRRATELATDTTRLTREKAELQQRLKELEAVVEAERQSFRRQLQEAEQRGSAVVELEGRLRDAESRVKNAYIDQEHFLTAKLNASVKTEEATRLAVRLREAEMDVERYKTSAECCEQKLDILKSEYYELKLKNSQRVMELEACLKAAEEKMKTLSDLELESELFISNLAQQSDGQLSLGGGGVGGDAAAAPSSVNALSSYESWLALPRSRKLAHTLTVTKRCLQLENRLTALQHDVEFKDKQIARLQASLEMAREALNNTSSPFAMVERTVERLTNENEDLHARVVTLTEDNSVLRQRLEQRTADVQVLCRHRKELLRIKRVLRRLGLEEQVGGQPATPGAQGPPQQQQLEREVQEQLDFGSTGARPTALRRDPPPEPHRQYLRYHADDSLRTTREVESAAERPQRQRQQDERKESQEVEAASGAAVVPQAIQITS
ncbi:hypothetical protein DQ04_12701020 [Trypanosoma grayi]|uniref:hypothetical protein n=1 Tax=Trypanosoma grayi TaxID=71804 RepID=UPI0004F43AEB|nr:hypothetical protein DQ04_12701020 [Trypanosoma grayi]KEG06699.1 hypothetical protein DQ04_12701020 [Trypanosoma grayi]